MARRAAAKATDPVTRYALDVVEGRIVAGRLVRLACERHLRDLDTGWNRGLKWDPDAAQHAIDFFRFLRHSKGEWAGRVVELQPWQQFRVGSVFGWMRLYGRCPNCDQWYPVEANGKIHCRSCEQHGYQMPDEPEELAYYRRFRTAYNEVARKNGKSTESAGIALYLLDADGEPGAEVYSAAPLALDTPILTTRGWITMGELRVGDQVFSEDGRPTTVTYLSPIVLRKTYRVRFDDGSELIATDNHLWTVEKRYTPRKGASQKYKTVTVSTEEIARSVTYGGRPRYRIKVAAPLQFDPKPLPIDPYVLGIWLGDGRSNRGSIVVDEGDLEIVREIEERGYKFSPHYSSKRNLVYGTILGLRTALRQMGLLENKHIPDVYKLASVEQRMDLLRGLMDSDGTVTKTGECRFVSTCERLARDVFELVLGLGFKAHIRSVPTKGRSDAWVVSFKAYDDTPVFNLSRKRKRQIQRNGSSTTALYRWIVAVEEVEPRPARCIAVDNPSHLFLAGDRLIATHNTKKDQAKIVWGEAARMVKKSPALRKRIKVFEGKGNMHVEETASKFEPLGADEDTLDGLNVHGAIIDELHAHKTRGVWDVLETATGSRRQPLIWAITTAGFDQNGICYELRTYSVEVLEGRIQDDTWFAYIATIDEGDDPFDEQVWVKANPNLGVSKKWEDMRRLAQKARAMPSALNNFLCKHLNVWVQQETRWIPMDLWDSNAGPVSWVTLPEKLRGRPFFGGLDLSSTTDITAWLLVFPRDDDPEEIDVVCRFWVPEARLYADDNRYRDQYQAWARTGALIATPGNAVDYEFVIKQVLEDARQFQLVDMNIDRLFQAHQVAVRLMDELGDNKVFGLGQGFMSLSGPAKELERRLMMGKVHHGGHPVLRWMAGNVSVKRDAADNIKPDKATSQGKIDGIVALIMALDRAMRHSSAQPKPSVYEQRGRIRLW